MAQWLSWLERRPVTAEVEMCIRDRLITSFIGSQCQGIRPALFFAWPFRYYSVNI